MGGFYYALGIFALFFGLIYWHYGLLAMSVQRYTKPMKKFRRNGKIKMDFPKLTIGEMIQSFIPFYQVAVVRKALYGSALVTTIASIFSLVTITFNIVISLFFPFNAYVVLFAHIFFFVGAVVAFFTYGIVTFDCARMYDCKMLISVLCFLFPYIFCFNVRNKIPHYMADIAKQGVFKEQNGNSRIKQKTNQ